MLCLSSLNAVLNIKYNPVENVSSVMSDSLWVKNINIVPRPQSVGMAHWMAIGFHTEKLSVMFV